MKLRYIGPEPTGVLPLPEGVTRPDTPPPWEFDLDDALAERILARHGKGGQWERAGKAPAPKDKE